MRLLSRLRRLLSGAGQTERIAHVEGTVAKFGREQRKQLDRHDARLDRLKDAVAGRAAAADVRAVERRIEDLQTSLGQLDRTVAEALERARLFDELAHEDRRLARRLESMVRHKRPIIVGPWTGEVGFEVLYWIPFVRWAVQTYDIAVDRLLIVSRGGVAGWYGLDAAYQDLFAFYTPEQFRAETEAAKKQRRVHDFDVEVVDRVRAARGIDRSSVLHPEMMYRLLMPFWKEQAPIARAERYASYARITAPRGMVADLPADYVAARFYFSDCFPDTSANRDLIAAILEAVARDRHVVLLNTPFAVDDHVDASHAGHRITTVDPRMMTPERNLAVQTAVVAGARAFVGTYGGFSYLAPFCGVPSLAFYSQATFQSSHLHAARRALERLGGPSVTAIDARDVPLVRLALSGALSTA